MSGLASADVLDRPVETDRRGGGGPARRAVLRWAWRLFRREWRQQLLILALIVVAVAATILGAAVGTNLPPPGNPGFGTAGGLVIMPGANRDRAAVIDAIRAHFGPVDVIENTPIATGLVQGALLRAQDPHGRYGHPMLSLVSGRYPVGPDQVALTGGLARTLGLRIGDLWSGPGRARRVVGLVQNPRNLLDDFALVAPGQLAAPDQVTVLFAASAAQVANFSLPGGVVVQIPHPSLGINPAVLAFIVAIFGLIFVGLVAVAGFSVLAQRRLRALGVLASLGATDRNVRLVMVANGAVVGVVAALVGAVLGLAGWLAYAPRLQASTHHVVVWTHLPWWLVGSTVALAVATATLAARRPARTAARTSVVAALSGRPASPRAAHRSAVPGLVLLAAGTLLLAFSGGWGTNTNRGVLFELGGILAVSVGLLLVAPACVTLLGVVARRAPIAARLALRDLARYRARSGAALAAISFAILIAVLISLLATGRYADPVDYFGPNLPPNELIVYPPSDQVGDGPAFVGPGEGQPAAGQPNPAALAAVANAVAAAVGSHDVLELDHAGATLGRSRPGAFLSYGGAPYVATPEVLRRYGIDPAAIRPDTMLITSRPGLAGTPGLALTTGEGHGCALPRCDPAPKIQTFPRLPTDTAEPNLLVTAHAVAALGLHPTPAAWLVQTARPLSAAQINAARQTAAAAGLTIETRNQSPSLSQVRDYATGAGILLALAILAMTVGLIRSETAADRQTLAATGASRRMRRDITAATAGSLGLLGALLGTATAYLGTVALFRSQLSQRMGSVPWFDLILIVVGLPVLAMLGGWLLAGREPPAITHQPIE